MQNLDLETLGHAAGVYQRHPRELESALAVVQAEAAMQRGEPIPHTAVPVFRLNAVAYFHAEQLLAAAQWLTARDLERAKEVDRL